MISRSTVDTVDLQAVLAEYELGTIYSVTGAGGTAGRTWKVRTSTGDYFLRLRGLRTSSEARLLYDHGLREHLIARGVPTVSAVRTRTGERWVRTKGRVYELYPFVVGRQFRPESEGEIAEAARALAEFHRAAADYRPQVQEPVAQYTTLGFSDEVSDRLDDPRLQLVNMLKVREMASSKHERELVDRCIARVRALMRSYAGTKYDRLAGWVVHGDYTPANLLFSEEGEVVGIFDLDWAMPGTRCRDVADGLYFFASVPRRIDPSDIWSLTEAADLDLDRCTIFLEAYHEVAPLLRHEVDAIPYAFAGRWFSVRLEGMAKVDASERFRFFSRDIEKPLLWFDRNWPLLRDRTFRTS